MKKFLALLLSMSLVFGLAACGGESATTPAPEGSAPAESGETEASVTRITLWTYPIGQWGGTDPQLDTIIAAFNEAHPEIEVSYELLDYTNGDTQVTSAITASNTPDIIMEGPERLVSNWGANGLMVDLSDLWTDTEADMTTHCMAINYEVFEQAGALQYIDEETRTWTTDGFVKAMEAVAASGLVSTPAIVYCGGQGGDQGTRALVNNLYSGTYTNADHTAYTANSAENVEALTLLQSMVNDGTISTSASFQASDELQAFANGTCAVTFAWNASNKAAYASQAAFTPFAMAFPSDDGVPELCGGIWGFGIFNNGDDAKIEAAKTFIKFVCDDAAQGPESVRLTGFFPVRSSFGDVYAGTDQAEQMSEFQSLMPYLGDYYNVISGWTEQRTNWFNMLQRILVSGGDPQTEADAFVEASNANI